MIKIYSDNKRKPPNVGSGHHLHQFYTTAYMMDRFSKKMSFFKWQAIWQ